VQTYFSKEQIQTMEDKYNGEQILVFQRKLLEELGMFQGISTEVDRYLDPILAKKNNKFHLRIEAEQDESLQQIIPYVLFVHRGEVFSYVRGKQAGETRLVGNRSVGIGGHVNPEDEVLFDGAMVASDKQTYLRAVQREIDEEIILDGPYEPKITALINDDSNPVGRVHFGIVHICELDHTNVNKREKQITKAGFIPVADLAGPRREELETWSQLCIDHLAKTS
jgi:predicted NUDIX family phosphoesterase